MKQGEAVFMAIVKVVGSWTGECVLSKEQRNLVRLELYEGFKAKSIVLSKEFTDKETWEYISGLISNWLRKDKRLNGGVKYVPTTRRVRVEMPVKAAA